ncbi:helix-turn-helix domain-containing protein [Paraburkholderia sp. BR14320]|uniref:helix-turn-helix domain-containing protein n=1 Tax=unclassified Paraburkholderia TaxID=2615204 RepID=UPI0034CFC4E5
MPNDETQRNMRELAGACRFVYNEALALQVERHKGGDKKLGYAGLCKLLTEWRNGAEAPWLNDAPVHLLQQALKDLEHVYTNFFDKRAEFPPFQTNGRAGWVPLPGPEAD